MLDIVIRGGRVVTPYGTGIWDVAVQGEQIAAVAAPGSLTEDATRVIDADGKMTPRGQAIMSHTPAGRLGAPEDLVGTLLWLVSPASTFVTGIVVPVDGGFSSFSGV